MEPSGNICPSCKQPLSADSPLGGLCPACLIRSGFYSGTAPEPEKRDKFAAPAVGDLAPHFPHLEIIELIGRGGMGAVYKARQPKLNRLVALKILAREGDTDTRFAERFQREAQALAHMNHPNIVMVHDFGEAGGHYYLLMEFVDGMNLRQLEQNSKLAPEEALTIVPPICDALQYAHGQGIVHRDIKPENILLDKSGRVKIADFGIAKILGTGVALEEPLTGDDQRVGTPHYMAPEQVEKPNTVDHRADIYSLGVVFYEMLTGELPLGRFAPPSQKVQVDVRLDEIVLRALEKEPELRYQQASEIRTQVETLSAVNSAARASGTKFLSGEAPDRAADKTSFARRHPLFWPGFYLFLTVCSVFNGVYAYDKYQNDILMWIWFIAAFAWFLKGLILTGKAIRAGRMLPILIGALLLAPFVALAAYEVFSKKTEPEIYHNSYPASVEFGAIGEQALFQRGLKAAALPTSSNGLQVAAVSSTHTSFAQDEAAKLGFYTPYHAGWSFSAVQTRSFRDSNYLNLDTGDFTSIPVTAEYREALTSHGVHLYYSPYQSNLASLTPNNVWLVKIEDAYWTGLLSDKLLQIVEGDLEEEGPVQMRPSAVTPGVYIFKTAQNLGLLKVKSLLPHKYPDGSNSLPGAIVQYKYLRNTPADSPASPDENLADSYTLYLVPVPGVVDKILSATRAVAAEHGWKKASESSTTNTQLLSYGTGTGAVMSVQLNTYAAGHLLHFHISDRAGTSAERFGEQVMQKAEMDQEGWWGGRIRVPWSKGTYAHGFSTVKMATLTSPVTSTGSACFDLDTGQVLEAPFAAKSGAADLWNWSAESGADLALMTSGSMPSLFSISNSILVHMPQELWDSGTTSSVKLAVDKADADIFRVPHFGISIFSFTATPFNSPLDPNMTPTYAFRTSEGKMGLLQILLAKPGSLEPPDAGNPLATPTAEVVFRYKLAETTSADTPEQATQTTISEDTKVFHNVMTVGSLRRSLQGENHWQVLAMVDESDILGVKVGQTATLQVLAIRGRDFSGKVVSVSKTPHDDNGVVSYQVTVDVIAPDPVFKPGMTANVSIEAEAAAAAKVSAELAVR